MRQLCSGAAPAPTGSSERRSGGAVRSLVSHRRGKYSRARLAGSTAHDLALDATLRAAAVRSGRARSSRIVVTGGDLRRKVREHRSPLAVCLRRRQQLLAACGADGREGQGSDVLAARRRREPRRPGRARRLQERRAGGDRGAPAHAQPHAREPPARVDPAVRAHAARRRAAARRAAAAPGGAQAQERRAARRLRHRRPSHGAAASPAATRSTTRCSRLARCAAPESGSSWPIRAPAVRAGEPAESWQRPEAGPA